jgi:hypothetical protein
MLDDEGLGEVDTTTSWIDRYITDRLVLKRETTQNTYALILRQFLIWLFHQPGHEPPFDPSVDFTQTAVQTYLFGELVDTSISHRERVKSILNGFQAAYRGWVTCLVAERQRESNAATVGADR